MLWRVEVGVESPPIWRVASNLASGFAQGLAPVHGDQLIPIGTGDRGLRSGDGMPVAFKANGERITGSSWRSREQSPVNLSGSHHSV